MRSDRRGVAVALGLYGASRIVTLIAAWCAHFVQPDFSPSFVLADKWDGSWFQTIIRTGYATHIPAGRGDVAQTNIAFFPGFPLLARAVGFVTGLSPRWSAVVASLVASGVAVVFVFLVARRLTDEDTALRSVALLVFFPAAFVLSMGYSEGLFLAAAAACLHCLLDRRWLLAGLAGAIGTATRPTGVVLVACCVVAAAGELRHRRSGWWQAAAAPVLAAAGVVAYFAYLAAHVGAWDAWFETERRGWAQHTDAGGTVVRHVIHTLRDPLATTELFNVVAIGVFLVGAVLLVRWRPPLVVTAYAVGVVAPALFAAVTFSSARYVMVAFPIMIAFARLLRGRAFEAVVASSAGLMVLLMMIASLSPRYVP